MNSQINIEGLPFEQIEETHMAELSSLADRLEAIRFMPIENEEDRTAARCAVVQFNSDMQSYLETNLSAKDYPRGTLGLHGPALGIPEGIEAPAI